MSGMTEPSDPDRPDPSAEPAPAAGPSLEPEPGEGPRLPARPLGPSVRALVGRAASAFGLVVLLLVAFGAGASADRLGLLGAGAPGGTSASSGDVDLDLIGEAWRLLHTEYVGAAELDSRALAYAAIDGMTEAVGDTGHTMFLTPDQLRSSTASLSGSYAGIGAQMDASDGQAIIVGVFRGSPADKAGLRSGDVVVAVDDSTMTGSPLPVVVAAIRGEPGTTVRLTIRREGVAAPFRVTIVRAQVEIPTVTSAMIPGTTLGMIRLEQFSSGAGETFRDQLKALLGRRITGLVLDLRQNPGGYVNEAVSIASEFLSSGAVYRQRDAKGVETTTGVTAGGIATRIPLVVLVDEGSASAAEIVTGALQDPGRATVIGTKTFGTGTVLGTFDLSDGSALRIGTVEWLTPDGREIWHDGLEPDVVVPLASDIRLVLPEDLETMSAGALRKDPDLQLRRAIELLSR